MFIAEDRLSQELFDFIHKPTVIALAWTFRFASLHFKDRYWNIMLFYLSVLFKCVLFADFETSWTVQDLE